MKVASVSGEGPLVIKLAGIVGGVGLYREGVQHTARAGFRVAAIDTAGDRRDDPARQPITWDFLTSEVLRGYDALGARRAILWGTSYGCMVALAVAARHPDRVRGLLLGHPPDPEVLPRIWGRVLAWTSTRPRPVSVTRALFAPIFGAMVGWEFAVPTAMVRAPSLVRASADAATPARTLREKLLLLWNEPPGLPTADACLPVSIIAGPLDLAAPLSGARRLARRLPGCSLRVLGWSGHSGHFSRPRTFGRLVVQELRRIDAAAGSRDESSFR